MKKKKRGATKERSRRRQRKEVFCETGGEKEKQKEARE